MTVNIDNLAKIRSEHLNRKFAEVLLGWTGRKRIRRAYYYANPPVTFLVVTGWENRGPLLLNNAADLLPRSGKWLPLHHRRACSLAQRALTFLSAGKRRARASGWHNVTNASAVNINPLENATKRRSPECKETKIPNPFLIIRVE